MAGTHNKRKLSILCLQERVFLINESDKGKYQRELAKQLSCGKTQIQNTLANRERYLKEWGK